MVKLSSKSQLPSGISWSLRSNHVGKLSSTRYPSLPPIYTRYNQVVKLNSKR